MFSDPMFSIFIGDLTKKIFSETIFLKNKVARSTVSVKSNMYIL